MAKVGGNFPLRGKLGDNVFTNGSLTGPRVRRAPKPSAKPKSPEFIYNKERIHKLSKLASGINNVLKNYHPDLRSKRFYSNMMKRFTKQVTENRFLILESIKGMDINPVYPYSRMGTAHVNIEIKKKKLIVSLRTTMHAKIKTMEEIEDYSYSLLLLTWGRKPFEVGHQQQYSDWIARDEEGHHEFSFEFDMPRSTIHWMLCLHQTMGFGSDDEVPVAYQAMTIHEVGSLLPEDLAIIEERKLPKQIEPIKEDAPKLRVKGKPLNKN